jgi:hypothetical protein
MRTAQCSGQARNTKAGRRRSRELLALTLRFLQVCPKDLRAVKLSTGQSAG